MSWAGESELKPEELTVKEKFSRAMLAAKGRITTNISPESAPHAAQAILYLTQAINLYASLPEQEELDEELLVLVNKVRSNLPALDMMKVSQAILSIVHAKAVPEEYKKPKQRTKSTTN